LEETVRKLLTRTRKDTKSKERPISKSTKRRGRAKPDEAEIGLVNRAVTGKIRREPSRISLYIESGTKRDSNDPMKTREPKRKGRQLPRVRNEVFPPP